MSQKNGSSSHDSVLRPIIVVALMLAALIGGHLALAYLQSESVATAKPAEVIKVKPTTTAKDVSPTAKDIPPLMLASNEFSGEQKTAIEEIVREYLLANPEIFLEIQAELEKRMAKAEEERIKTSIGENAEFLYRRKDAPMAGDPDGDVTVVEWFDYNCGYCKRSYKQIASLIEKDPKVRVVFLEYPILSKGSEEASRVALAARRQGKYWDMHGALLQHRGRADMAAALKIAEKLGLDMERLKKDAEGEEVKAEIKRVSELAQKMGINGTPHFLVGDRSIAGAPGNLLEELKKKIASIRKDGCAVC